MERVLRGNTKAKFTQQANLVRSCIFQIFTMVMATMTLHIFQPRPEIALVYIFDEAQGHQGTYFH